MSESIYTQGNLLRYFCRLRRGHTCHVPGPDKVLRCRICGWSVTNWEPDPEDVLPPSQGLVDLAVEDIDSRWPIQWSQIEIRSETFTYLQINLPIIRIGHDDEYGWYLQLTALQWGWVFGRTQHTQDDEAKDESCK